MATHEGVVLGQPASWCGGEVEAVPAMMVLVRACARICGCERVGVDGRCGGLCDSAEVVAGAVLCCAVPK